jgi:hypothetical protein
MQGKRRPILRAIGASLGTVALVLLLLTVSHAAYPGRHPEHHGQPGTPRHDKPRSTPSASASQSLVPMSCCCSASA